MIADFLKGTVSESLNKLVQPAAVVPATLFVLLNLAFVYPAAKGAGPAKSFAGLAETWQVVVVAAIILALGYLLLNAANGFIDVLAGQSWRNSGLNWWLRGRQRTRRHQLETKANAEPAKLSLKWELATHYPSIDPAETTQATRLGNVLVATQHIVWKRYGFDIAALWSQMEANKELEETPAIASVKDEKSTLDLLANLVFVLALFGVEALVFYSARDRWGAALLSLLAFVAAYVCFRVAVASARSWGDAMQVVLDLHRDELRAALGLRDPDGLEDERKLWRGARHLYLPGDDQPPPKTLFKALPKPKVAVAAAATATANEVAAEVVDAVVDDPLPTPPAPVAGQPAPPPVIASVLLRYVDYLFVVTRAADGDGGVIDVVVDDPHVRRVREPPEVTAGAATAKANAVAAGAREQLHWQVDQLTAGSSIALSYRLPLWRLEVTGSAPAPKLVDRGARGVELNFGGGGGTQATVSVESFAPLAPPRLLINGEGKPMNLIDRTQGLFRADTHTLVGDDTLWVTLPRVAP